MKFVARLCSLFGATLMNLCLLALAVKLLLDPRLPAGLQGNWGLVFGAVGVAAVLIALAEWLGSDLTSRGMRRHATHDRSSWGRRQPNLISDLLLWDAFQSLFGDHSDNNDGWFGGSDADGGSDD